MNEEKDLPEGEELGIILARGKARKAKEDEARRNWESSPPEVKMNPPFDTQEATQPIVRVMHDQERFGCGFVVADQYVITAAYCLPQIPISNRSDDVLTTIRSWDGSDETNLAVIYCDIFSDIAILAWETFYGDELGGDGLDRRLVLLRVGSADIDLSFPLEMLQPFYVRTHEGVWLSGLTEPCGFDKPCFDAVIDEGDIPGGTSGSPVFNQKGEVIGLVSSRGEWGGTQFSVTCPWLAGALPRWYIRELDEWQKEQEVTNEIN